MVSGPILQTLQLVCVAPPLSPFPRACLLALAPHQAKAQLVDKCSSAWQRYQQRFQGLAGCSFPEGDGSQVLPPDAVFAACSAERPAAAKAADTAGGMAAGAPASAPEATAGAAAAAAAAAGSSPRSSSRGSSSSIAGEGDGLWQHLNLYYFHDGDKLNPK
jgi:hypothetical protein